MKKVLSLFLFLVCLYILFMQGFGFPSIPPAVDLILRLFAAGSIQIFFCTCFRKKMLQFFPLMLTLALALWGTWLFCTSDSWRNASILDLLADYCSPAFGCALVCLLKLPRKTQ